MNVGAKALFVALVVSEIAASHATNHYPQGAGEAEQNGEPDHYLYNSDDMHKCLHGDRIVLKDAVNCMIEHDQQRHVTCDDLRQHAHGGADLRLSAPYRPINRRGSLLGLIVLGD